MDRLIDRSFGQLEVVGTEFGIVPHLDRQRSFLDALEFVVDVDRRLRVFFGTQIQDPQSYLVPAERNPRSGAGAGGSIGFEVVVALLDRTGATSVARMRLASIRGDSKHAA